MAYVVGITIVGLVDNKLDKLTIQLPERWNNERKSQQQNKYQQNNNNNSSNLEFDEWDKKNNEYEKIMKVARDMKRKNDLENSMSANITTNSIMSTDNIGSSVEYPNDNMNPYKNMGFGNMDANNVNINVNTNTNTNTNIERFSNLDPDRQTYNNVDMYCSNDIGNNKIEPTKDHMYPYEPVNFPHPLIMSKIDLSIYKSSYHPRMTNQDYKNWLGAFDNENDIENLKKIGVIHYENLLKLKEQLKKRKNKNEKIKNGNIENKNENENKCLNNKIGYDFSPFDELCNKNTDITPPLYQVPKVGVKQGRGMYPHLACPFMSYDVNKLIGYNFGEYSEFR